MASLDSHKTVNRTQHLHIANEVEFTHTHRRKLKETVRNIYKPIIYEPRLETEAEKRFILLAARLGAGGTRGLAREQAKVHDIVGSIAYNLGSYGFSWGSCGARGLFPTR